MSSFIFYSQNLFDLILVRHLKQRERNRRYKMIRDHGLIVQRKTLAWLTKYSDALKVNKTNQISTGRFIAFMQITDGMSFDFLVESLKFACDTKKYLQRLLRFSCLL